MSDDHSDVGAMEHEADHADMTDNGEVELNLPLETVEEQLRTSEDTRKPPGAINPGTMALDLEERHRFEPGARSKWPRHGLPLPSILAPRSPGTGATANVGESGADRRGFGVPCPFVPELQQGRQSAGIVSPARVDLERHQDIQGLGEQLPGDGTQTNSNPYTDVRTRHIDQNRRDQSQASRC